MAYCKLFTLNKIDSLLCLISKTAFKAPFGRAPLHDSLATLLDSSMELFYEVPRREQCGELMKIDSSPIPTII